MVPSSIRRLAPRQYQSGSLMVVVFRKQVVVAVLIRCIRCEICSRPLSDDLIIFKGSRNPPGQMIHSYCLTWQYTRQCCRGLLSNRGPVTTQAGVPWSFHDMSTGYELQLRSISETLKFFFHPLYLTTFQLTRGSSQARKWRQRAWALPCSRTWVRLRLSSRKLPSFALLSSRLSPCLNKGSSHRHLGVQPTTISSANISTFLCSVLMV